MKYEFRPFTIAMHPRVWVLLLVIPYASTDQIFDSFDLKYLLLCMGLSAVLILIFYFNYFFLIPRYLLTKRYWLYFSFLMVAIAAVTQSTMDIFGHLHLLYGKRGHFSDGQIHAQRHADSSVRQPQRQRMPATHRLDLSATYEKPAKGRFQSSWSFGLYNVYGHQNPFSITFRENADNPQQIDAVQTSLFRWVPSVTYNFKF